MVELLALRGNPHLKLKVIGVGGGGGNAVNHMYREGIKNRHRSGAFMAATQVNLLQLRSGRLVDFLT